QASLVGKKISIVAQRTGKRGVPSAVAVLGVDSLQRGNRVPERLVRQPAVAHFVRDIGELLLRPRFLAARMSSMCALEHGPVSFARLAVPPLAAVEVRLEQIGLQRIDPAYPLDRLLRQVQSSLLDRGEIQTTEILIGLQGDAVRCARERAAEV